jgi:hypothetical protein
MGISRHIEMQDLPPVVADDEKAVQNTKRERWDGEVSGEVYDEFVLKRGRIAPALVPCVPRVCPIGNPVR